MSLFEVRANKEIRRGSLVFSALHLASLGSSLEKVIVLCSGARLITLTVPLIRQNNQRVLTNEILEGNLAIDLRLLSRNRSSLEPLILLDLVSRSSSVLGPESIVTLYNNPSYSHILIGSRL